jgi:hypothetical protein
MIFMIQGQFIARIKVTPTPCIKFQMEGRWNKDETRLSALEATAKYLLGEKSATSHRGILLNLSCTPPVSSSE